MAADAELTVALDDASVKAIADTVAKALEKGFKDAVNGIEKSFKKMADDLGDTFTKMTDNLGDTLRKGMGKAGKTAGKDFSKAWAKEFKEALPAIERELARSMQATARVFNQDVADMAAGAQQAMKDVIGSADQMMSPRSIKNAKNMSQSQMRMLMEGSRKQRSGAWGAIEQSNVQMSAFGKIEAQRIAAEGRLTVQAQRDAAKMQQIQAAAAARAAAQAQRVADRAAQTQASAAARAAAQAQRAADKMQQTQAAAAARSSLARQRDAARLRQQQTSAAARMQLAKERSAGQLLAIEYRAQADRATSAARIAGEQRVAITKGVVRALVALEKGVGAAIAGTARTITSAISRMVSGVSSGLNRMASGVGNIFRRSNNDMTSGLNESLNRRERMMRSSFTQQEQIVSRSVLRQQEQITKLQAASSKGVVGAVTGRGIGGGLAALGGGMAIGAWLKSGYQEAVNLNEQLNKTNVVFGESAKSVVAFADNAVNSFGATKAEALTAAGTFGNLFRSVKLGEEQSAEMSTTLVQLAGDLSSFNNVSIDEAFDALRSGLVGETEPLKRFGVNLNDASLKAKALEMGLYGGKGVLDANTKAQAAYALILEQTSLAQGDFARTSEQGANAQRRTGKALKELSASIMGAFIPIMTKAFNVLTVGFTAMTNIIKDQTNPVLHVLKRALLGAAAGMAAVLAAKGIIEVFRLLGPAIKLTLTPLGMLLVTFGVIGAAISVMMDRSAALRETIKILGNKFAEIGAKINQFIQPLRDAAGSVLDDYVIPAIDRLATWLADNLVGAFDAVVHFITGTVIPALKSFAGFVMNTVWPAIKNIGLAIGAAFMAAVRAVQSFWSSVQPLIQPAIDGFSALGSAIGALFGGNASQMKSGATSALGGIGESIGNIVSKIGEMLAPVATKIKDWFLGLFTADKIKTYIKGILWFVEQVGYWVAKIVTHPNFIKAIGVIAAAAVVLGATLLKGLVRGILDNIPGLMDMLASALSFVFKTVIDNLGIVAIAAFATWLFGAKLMALFKGSGADAGKAFVGGFKTFSMSSMKAFLSGPSGIKKMIADNTRDANKQMLREFNRNNMLLAAGGQTTIGRPAVLTDQQAIKAKAAVDQLRTSLGDTAFAALEARTRMDAMMNVIRQSPGVIRGFGVNLEHAANTGKTGFGKLREAFKLTLSEMRTMAAGQGLTIGETLKSAMSGALSGAAMGIGGFMTGQAMGKSGASGGAMGLTAAMTGITTGLAVGASAGGPIGALVGGGVAALTLLGGAFGAAGKKAEEFKKKVAEISATFKDDLIKALESGAINLDKIRDGLVDLGDVASSEIISKTFVEQLGADGIAVMDSLALNWEKNFQPIVDRGGSADQMKAAMLGVFSDTLVASSDFRERFGADAAAVAQALREEFASSNISPTDMFDRFESESHDLHFVIEENKEYLRSLIYTAGDVTRSVDMSSEAIGDATKEVGFLAKESANIDASPWQEYYNAVNTAAKGNQEAIENNKVMVDLLGEAWQTAVNAVADYQLLGSGSSFQQAVDAALVQIDGLGPRIAESIKNGATITGQNPISASLRQDLDGLGADLAAVVQNGIANGTIMSPADALTLTQGLRAAALDGLDPGTEAYNLIAEKFDNALSAMAPKIDEAVAAAEGKKFAEEVTAAMEKYGVGEIEAKIIVKEKNLAFQGGTTANRFGGTEIVRSGLTVPAKVNLTAPSTKEVHDALQPSGKNAAEGFASGISKYIFRAVAAARSMVNAVKNTVNTMLDAHSPSRVFIGIGGDIATGLAIGIEDGTEDAAGAARSIVNAAVSSAVNAAQAGTAAVTAATAELFGAMTGAEAPTGTGGKAMGLSQVISEITNATQGLNTTAASSAQSVWDATAKSAKDRTAADKNLIGESASSLNPADVVGAANLSAVMQVLESIRQYGMTLLGSGSPVNEVIAKVQSQVDAFMKNATALGFKKTDLSRIVDEMGLSVQDLAAFAGEASGLTNIVAPARNVLPPIPMGQSMNGMSASQSATGATANGAATQNITMNLYLPTGDPEANALTVANRLASLV